VSERLYAKAVRHGEPPQWPGLMAPVNPPQKNWRRPVPKASTLPPLQRNCADELLDQGYIDFENRIFGVAEMNHQR